MNPFQQYQADLAAGVIYPDPEQQSVVIELQRIYENLVQRPGSWRGLANRLLNKRRTPVKGLYLWGSVGVGKTYLMDLFYNSLPIKHKLRMHFHLFMAEVHQLLTQLQGQRDPLQRVASYFATKARVLCFDEFFVNDIGDAMILGNLLTALFQQGVCLVTTSNVVPAELYKNGLQRSAFLPTIALLEKNTQIKHIQTQRDYRLRSLTQAGVYFFPLNLEAEQHLANWFSSYVADKQTLTQQPLTLLGRTIAVVQRAEGIVWFKFQDLCNIPRSQNDYLAIAEDYPIMIVSDIPQFTEQDVNAITYLINLVDICYDWQVKLVVSAAVPIKELYLHGRLFFEFQRTVSRLQEMQSKEYLSKPHKKLL